MRCGNLEFDLIWRFNLGKGRHAVPKQKPLSWIAWWKVTNFYAYGSTGQIMWLPTPPCASWSSTSSWSFNSSSSFRLCSYTSDLWPTNYKKEKCYSFHDLWVVNKNRVFFEMGAPWICLQNAPLPYILYFCNSCLYTEDLDVFQSWGGAVWVSWLFFLKSVTY